MRRRLFVPEVVQTSEMDCGPAALACLLGGLGVPASYARLREACQTDVDGTSIDALEDTARLLGIDAEQVMMPVDHLLIEETQALPAIVATRLPSGLTHFVVAWRRHGRYVQVMDPAVGRRWVRASRFLHDVYVHDFAVPAEAFTDWARSDAFLGPVARALEGLGLRPEHATSLVEQAHADEGWETAVALDAAARSVRSLVEAKAVRRGREAAAMVEQLSRPGARADLPPSAWFARPGPDGDDVPIRGAVLVRAPGLADDPPADADLPEDLRAARREKRPRPARVLWDLLKVDGHARPVALAATAVAAGLGTAAEALLFRGVINAATGHRAGTALAALVVVELALFLVEAGLAASGLGLGRAVESHLRGSLLRLLPRLPDPYFRSRPISDLSERAHRLQQLRQLPTLGADLLRAGAELVAITVGIIVVNRASAPPAILGAVAAVAIAAVTSPLLSERDLRLRCHSGAAARFYLDGLLGLAPIRAHSAEGVVEGGHANLLAEWAAAARAAARPVVTAEAVQAALGVVLAVWLVAAARERAAVPATFLLLAYWALAVPVLGQRIGVLARQYPSHRNTTMRFLEPLSVPQELGPEAPDQTPISSIQHGGADLRFRGVRVHAGGQVVLDGIDLHIPGGTNVAVVGSSGAGKSSLVGLLLGWHRPSEGEVVADGEPLDRAGLQRLRRATAWVDPSVAVWNRSMHDNLVYGQDAGAAASPGVAGAMGDADLAPVVARLPNGLDEPLGEGGALLSGGEAQRVRLARARLREGVRLAILDEPFRGLDADQRRAMLERCRGWWPGATTILVTHDVADTANFDRVLVVEAGRIVEEGSPADLDERPHSRYRALLDAQRATALAGGAWRRLRVEDGLLTTTKPSR